MSPLRLSLVALVALLAFGVFARAELASDAALAEHQVDEPEMRDVEYVDEWAQKIGLAEVASDSDSAAEAADAAEEAADAAEAAADEQALLQVDSSLAAAEPPTIMWDEEDQQHHVYVEAQSESGISTMAETAAEKKKQSSAKAAAKKSKPTSTANGAANVAKPQQEDRLDGPPASSHELLSVRTAPAPGQLPLENTFRSAPVASPKGESSRVVNRRIQAAKAHLEALAREEHVKARADYVEKLEKYKYARATDKARQSRKFERALPPTQPILPHPASNAATFNGDRNFNTLFPAATAKSDGKASSQEHDFQHRGDGDSYADHTNLVEHASEMSVQQQIEQAQQDALLAQEDAAAEEAAAAAADAPAEAAAEAEAPAEVDTNAVAGADANFEAQAAADADAAAAQEAEAKAEAEAAAAQEAASTAAAEADTAAAAEAEASADKTEAAAAEEARAAEEAEAGAAQTVKEPCAEQCDKPGAWRTAECQDCIVRGMVNGWIVKSIVDKQPGYNYVHYARNKCVAYANELRLRSTQVKGAPFAHCFFQKVHETCNL